MSNSRPFIVGLGGGSRPGSSTDRALAAAMRIAEANGARARTFTGDWLADLPIYRPERPERSERQRALVEAVAVADAVIVATPAYHAGPSGLVKNALDLLEDLSTASRPYLDGRPVGVIVTTGGWQGGAATLQAVRATIHALRGWPTPLGVVLQSNEPLFDTDGNLLDAKADSQLRVMVDQLTGHSSSRATASRWTTRATADAPA